MRSSLFIVAALQFATVLTGCVGLTQQQSAGTHPSTKQPDLATELQEARSHFTFHGQPIHPKIVKAFDGWISDRGPNVLALSVSNATGSNEYSEPTQTIGRLVRYNEADDGAAIWYGYEDIGRLKDGTQVVRSSEHGEHSSGVFETILLFRFRIQPSMDLSFPVRNELVMYTCGSFGLGDRDDGKIEVEDDRIIVGPSKYQQTALVLMPRENK
jgi:hypothetical protein